MYQKMISYMYEYVNGEKRSNIGFAKIALQNQNYKIKIHIKNSAFNGRVLQVYGFVRGEGILHSSCFGSVKVVNGIGEGIFTGNTGEVWEKYRFLDMGGLILCDAQLTKQNEETEGEVNCLQPGKIRFCATQWEEGDIAIEQLDIFKERWKIETVPEQNADRKELQAAQVNADRKELQVAQVNPENTRGEFSLERDEFENNGLSKEAKKMSSVEGLRMQKEMIEQNSLAGEDRDTVQKERDDTKRNVDKEEIPTERSVLNQKEIPTERRALNRKESPTERKVLNQEERQSQTKQGVFKQEEENSGNYHMQQRADEIEQAAESEENEDIWDLFEQRRKKMELQFEEIKNAKVEEKVWQPGEEILEKYPEMCPFFDSNVLASVRMEPKDIGILPMEFWYLANNSFLLHGYYCYRHLLFLKMKVEQELVYAIAIPGNSNYREKFMANMFGFEQFKTVHKKENAGFGYWWKRIY